MNSLVLLARPKCGLLTVASRAASAAAAQNPVQRLFVEKVREFKTTNKGLDGAHQRAMEDEMKRLKRVFSVEDESKLAHIEPKFPAECNVSLRDIDETQEKRRQIASGEYQKQIAQATAPKSELLESIPEQVTLDLHLPPHNKPNVSILLAGQEGKPLPAVMGETVPDYMSTLEPMTSDKLQREMCVRFGPDMPTIHDDEKPGRDLVNFPRVPQPIDTPPTKHHVIPESWFKFFYPKTGVSGFYTFAGTFGTFLYSKEWLVYEHEMIGAISCTVVISYVILKFGKLVSSWAVGKIKERDAAWDDWQTGNIKFLTQLKDHFTAELEKPNLIEDLYQIREHDINLQVQNEYRNRVLMVHNDVKRRLNYLVSVAESKRQIAHQNMVNWVISNAVSSFGPKQESEVLDNCILNLKQLASKNANAI